MENYDLELDKAIDIVKKARAKSVLIQLPEGLKPKAKVVVDEIEAKTSAKCLIWLGNCYGACDLPLQIQGKVDLVLQFGHNRFVKQGGWKND